MQTLPDLFLTITLCSENLLYLHAIICLVRLSTKRALRKMSVLQHTYKLMNTLTSLQCASVFDFRHIFCVEKSLFKISLLLAQVKLFGF